MPLTSSGKLVLNDYIKKYGDELGKKHFYASINAGNPGSKKWNTITNKHRMKALINQGRKND